MKLHAPDGVFHRLYICFEVCKKGFVEGYRPLISIDGCQLKRVFKEQLLVVIQKDANENIFPIVYTVIEVGSKKTWLWLLELLLENNGLVEDFVWNFFSDRQKVFFTFLY